MKHGGTFIIALFHGLDQRIDLLERRLDGLERRMDRLERRINDLEWKMDAGFSAIDTRLSTLESKLDLFIEAHTTFNRLVDARLRRLEGNVA